MIGLLAAGFAIEGAGKLRSSRDQARALNTEANYARLNADLAIEEAKFNAQIQSIESRKVLGEQEAGFAAGNLEGASVMATIAESATNAEMDRLSIIHGGNVRAANFRSEAEAKTRAAKSAKKAGIFEILSSGLDFATSAYGKGSPGGSSSSGAGAGGGSVDSFTSRNTLRAGM